MLNKNNMTQNQELNNTCILFDKDNIAQQEAIIRFYNDNGWESDPKYLKNSLSNKVIGVNNCVLGYWNNGFINLPIIDLPKEYYPIDNIVEDVKSEPILEQRIKMNLDDEVQISFKNDIGETKEITVTVKDLLENTTDDFCEWLDDTEPCTSASCNNESQNFCDCGSSFEDYEIVSLSFTRK